MKKLDIYIIKRFLGTFVFSIILIISISVVFDFSEKIDNFIEKDAPFNAIVFDYYMNFIPYFVNLFSYLFTFISVIFFTAKMASQTEFVAILSSGISFNRLLLPYFVSATIIAVFSFFLSSYIIPHANIDRLNFENTYINRPYYNNERHIHKQIEANTYIYMQSYNTSDHIGDKFSLEKFENGQLKLKLLSKHIRWDTLKNTWTIKDYYIRHINGEKEHIEKGKKLDTLLNFRPEDFSTRANIVETMNNPELERFIQKEIESGNEHIEYYLIEKYKRYAAPFATFILTLIGVSISCKKSRRGIGTHIGVGLLISFTYILFQQVSAQLAIGHSVNPIVAVWAPNVIFLVVAVVLYRMAPK